MREASESSGIPIDVDRVAGVALTHLHADHVFLELIAASGDRFERDERQKPFEAIDLLKRRAAEDAVQMAPWFSRSQNDGARGERRSRQRQQQFTPLHPRLL